MALVTGHVRSASAIAKTDVEVIAFRKEDFLSILRGNSESIEFILNLSKRRQEPSWQIISKNAALSRMTNAQRTRLQAILIRREFKKGEALWKSGSSSDMAFLVAEGIQSSKQRLQHHMSVIIALYNAINVDMICINDDLGQVQLENKPELEPFISGSFIGETNEILTGTAGKHANGLVGVSDGWGYVISSKEWIDFLNRNPGVKLAFLDAKFIDVVQADQVKMLQSLQDPYSCEF